MTGPETGTLFWSGEYNGSVVPGQYANWNSGEPNNSGGDENCAEYYSASSKWNDLPCSGTTLSGYVVEFGAPGNLPSVTAKNISLTTSASYSLTYTAGAHGSITGSTSQTVIGGGSGTAVTAVPAAGYSFTGWSDSTSTNPRIDTNVAGNISVTANFSDITAPTVPGVPTVSAANTVTPTWSWAASTDLGSGVIDYLLKWSHNSDCNGGFSADTGGATSYTIPGGASQMSDGTWYFCASAQDSVANTSVYSAAGSVTTDTVVPVISSILATPSLTGVVIAWTTNEVASSIVTYGPTTPPTGTITAEADTSPRVLSHSVTIPSLACGSTYYFKVTSKDAATNSTTSTITSFTTTACLSAGHSGGHSGGAVTPSAVVSAQGVAASNNGLKQALTFAVDNGAKTTSSPSVSIAMNADPLTVSGYAISLDPTFTNDGIHPYTGGTAIFTLPDISGKYTVYLQYYSTTGKVSELFSKTISYEKNGPATPVAITFKRSLRYLDSGSDVTNLQQFLNTHGFTVSKTGAGSLGHETNTFGPKVLAAVKLYQKANKISPVSGIVGPLTLKAMLSGN